MAPIAIYLLLIIILLPLFGILFGIGRLPPGQGAPSETSTFWAGSPTGT